MLRLLPAALGLLAFAHPAGFVNIRAGDEVRIAGTQTGCVVQEVAIFCFHYAKGAPLGQIAPVVGSYGTLALGGGHQVYAYKARAGGKTTIVFKKAAGVPGFAISFYPEPADRVVHLKVGQVARVQGAKLDCAIVRAGSRNLPSVYCVTDDKVGPVLKTYATLVSDDGIAVGVIGAGRKTTFIYVHRQP